MSVLKCRSHTDGGRHRYISTSGTVPYDSFMAWLTVDRVFATTSVNNKFLFILSNYQTYCPIFKNGSSKIIFKDTEVFNTYISNFLIACFFLKSSRTFIVTHVT